MIWNDSKGIWVFAEQQNGKIESTVFELLAKAQDLKKTGKDQSEVTAVLLGCGISDLSRQLIEFGADCVLEINDKSLEFYDNLRYREAITQLALKYRPSIFLFGATYIGRELAPMVMWDLQTGLTADAIDILFDEDGTFVQTTPAYGGKIAAHIAIPEHRPQMVTVHPHVFMPAKQNKDATGKIVKEAVKVSPVSQYALIGTHEKESEGRDILDVDLLVSVGRGIKNKEDLSLMTKLADLLGGEVACSRPIVDAGWLSHDKQIGQSGKTVKPKCIINFAISGSVQYVSGMKNSGLIISVNRNEEAPIFDVSDYIVKCDYKKVAHAMINCLEQ